MRLLKKTIGLCTDLVASFHVWHYRLLFGYGLIIDGQESNCTLPILTIVGRSFS
jgi:hypothetical protein